MENEFDKIIQEAIAKAEKVPCPMEDFVQGLHDMMNTLQHRLECEVYG